MRARPRRGALGLRGRIVGAVLVTTVATLAVAAVALLGPLEHKLARVRAGPRLVRDLERSGAAAELQAHSDLGYVLDTSALTLRAQSAGLPAGSAASASSALSKRARGDRDAVRLSRTPRASACWCRPHEASVNEARGADRRRRAARSGPHTPIHELRHDRRHRRTRGSRIPFNNGGRCVRARRAPPITRVPGPVRVVRTAFITAALAGLALTLILGIPLAATLVRRLRRLRQAALQLAEPGRSVEVPVDRARDEVGDLARTFAIMQGRLQQQEEARRAFVATASHELRTPLTSLDGMLELLDDDLRAGAPTSRTRARCWSGRGPSRGGSAAWPADLLDLSRLDAEVQLRSEPVELGELSRAVLAEFELGTTERGIISALEETGRAGVGARRSRAAWPGSCGSCSTTRCA